MPNPSGTNLPNQARYNVQSNSIVDEVTCLQWQRDAGVYAYEWEDALEYCSALSLDGADDWRLPTRIEMASILDFTEFDGVPASFLRLASWTSSTIADDGRLWAFEPDFGGETTMALHAVERPLRCVRSDGTGEGPEEPAVAPPNQYTEIAAGQVQDNYTGLIWQQGASESKIPFGESAAYCASLELGGEIWRVPSIRELATLVDEARSVPAINAEMFPGTPSGMDFASKTFFWASHRFVSRTGAGWAIEFGSGHMLPSESTATNSVLFTTALVKCVR